MNLANNYDVKIHAGGNVAWDASEATLNWLDKYLKPNMRTIETGAGKTTLLFAQKGAIHIAVTPSQSEIDNIKNIAQNDNINIENVRFANQFSQDVLPHLSKTYELDLILIDGGHGFPIPQIDFFYTAPLLKIGGKLIIDDVDLWTGKILVDFLKTESGWALETILRGRTAIFTKTGSFESREWCDQPFVVRKSRFSQFQRKIINAFSLLLKFDIATLKAKFKQESELSK